MAKSLHETYHVRQPDFVPEGQEHLHPHLGGIFCDFIPEGKTAIEIRPTDDATPAPAVSTEPIPNFPPEDETLETLLAEEKPRKK